MAANNPTVTLGGPATGAFAAHSAVPTNAYSHLPERAQHKLRMILEQNEDDHQALRELIDREQEARAALYEHQQRLRQLQREPLGMPLPEGIDEHPAITQVRGQLAQAEENCVRLQERTRAITARRSRCLVRCRAYADSLRGQRVAEWKGEATVPPGVDTIVALRDHITLLRKEARAVEERPPHSDTVREMLREQIKELARQGEPDVLRSIELGVPLRFPVRHLTDVLSGFTQMPDGAQPPVRVMTNIDVPDLTSMWLFFEQDKVIKYLDKQITHLAEDANALSATERAAELKRIAAEVLECERAEEAFLEREMLAGARVQRRGDADPRAVMGLSSDLPAPRS